jgi:ATP-dependent DNA ligase
MVDKDTLMLCDSITEEEAIGLPDIAYTSNLKFDGNRILAVVKNGQVALLNRRGYNPYKEFAEVVEDLKFMPDCILDGEVIDFSDTFNVLQRRAGTRNPIKQAMLRKEIPVKFMVFDILQLNGQTLTGLMLRDRIPKLQNLFIDFNKNFIDRKPFVEMAEYKPIKEMLEQAHKEDREGIIVKSLNGSYEGRRSKSWLKCKFLLEKDLKMTKYTINPKGIRVENEDGIAVQIAGNISNEAKKILDTYNEITISIRYLEQTQTGMYRFPSFKEIVYTDQIYS